MIKIKQGFTLIELMIVIAIIGIMATYALPTYQDYIIRSQIEEGIQIADSLKKSINDIYQQYQYFPANNVAAGVPAAKYLIGNYVTSIQIEGGAIHIQLGNRINRQVDEKILSIRPVSVNDSPTSPLAWVCGYAPAVPGMKAHGENKTTIPALYLSHKCRHWESQQVKDINQNHQSKS